MLQKMNIYYLIYIFIYIIMFKAVFKKKCENKVLVLTQPIQNEC